MLFVRLRLSEGVRWRVRAYSKCIPQYPQIPIYNRVFPSKASSNDNQRPPTVQIRNALVPQQLRVIKLKSNTDTGAAAAADHLSFIRSQRGAPLLVHSGFVYRCERKSTERSYWLCTGYKRFKCTGRIICHGNAMVKATMHIHDPEWARIGKTVLEKQDMDAADRNDFLNSIKR